MSLPTLSDLITKVRRRANLEHSQYISTDNDSITDAEITDYLNEGGAELHEEIASSNEDFSVTTIYRTIANGSNTIDLPDDFWLVRNIAKQFGDGYTAVVQFDRNEQTKFEHPFYATYIDPIYQRVFYNLANNTLTIEPATSAPALYRISYVPQFTNLVSNSDTVSHPQNWTDYMVLYAALQCRIVENVGSVGELQSQVERMKDRIKKASASRGQPLRMTVIRNRGRFFN